MVKESFRTKSVESNNPFHKDHNFLKLHKTNHHPR
jgi:hypothetical protein